MVICNKYLSFRKHKLIDQIQNIIDENYDKVSWKLGIKIKVFIYCYLVQTNIILQSVQTLRDEPGIIVGGDVTGGYGGMGKML